MSIKTLWKKMGLFLFVGSFHIAVASVLLEWEEKEGDRSEETISRGLGEEIMPIPDEEDFQQEAFVEISAPVKRQNYIRTRQKGLNMVQLPSAPAKDIKDETNTTGENAKKRLPSYLKPQEFAPFPFFQEINNMVHPLPTDIHQGSIAK